MASITVYQHSGFSGSQEEYTAEVPNLVKLNDRVSSCRVQEGTWILYTGKNYSIESSTSVAHIPSILIPGDYRNHYAFKLENDKVSSLRPLPAKGICLFEKPNYCGKMVAIAEGIPKDHLDFAAQSVIVLSGEWSLFTEERGAGDTCNAPIGRYAHLPQAFLNKSVASVRPAPLGNLIVISRAAGDVPGSAPKLDLLDNPSVELILDASGSMGHGADSSMEQAKKVLTDLIDNDLPDGIQVALRVFGPANLSGEKTGTKGITTLVQKLEKLDRENLKTKINTIRSQGSTPIAASLQQAQKDFAGVTGSKLVVLITDGNENCGGNVEQAIKDLRAAFDTNPNSEVDDFEVVMNVVGFTIGQDWLKQKFTDWAKAGGGGYYDATDSGKLYTLTKAALRIPYRVLHDYHDKGSGFVDGEAVELQPNAGYAVMLDFKTGQNPDGSDTFPDPITGITVKAGETTTVNIVRWS